MTEIILELSRSQAESLMKQKGFSYNDGYHCFSRYFMNFFFEISEGRKGLRYYPRKNFEALIGSEKERLGLD